MHAHLDPHPQKASQSLMACSPDLFSGKKSVLEQNKRGSGGGGEPTEGAAATAPVARCQREDGKKNKKKTEEAFLESNLKGRDGGLDRALTQST